MKLVHLFTMIKSPAIAPGAWTHKVLLSSRLELLGRGLTDVGIWSRVSAMIEGEGETPRLTRGMGRQEDR